MRTARVRGSEISLATYFEDDYGTFIRQQPPAPRHFLPRSLVRLDGPAFFADPC